MKMWIARDKDNVLSVFREKPFLLELPAFKSSMWVYETPCGEYSTWRSIGESIDPNSFPEVTFENSPMEVELKLASNEDN